jgi:hypothetical protein
MKHSSEGKPTIFFHLANILAFFLIPLTLLAAVFLNLLLSPGFYTSTLARADLIGTYVEVATLKTNREIEQKIDEKVNLDDVQQKYDRIKEEYEAIHQRLQEMGRESEFQAAKKSLEDTRDLEWSEMKDLYPDKEKFQEYKKNEIQRLEDLLRSIRTIRNERQEDIASLKEKLEEKKDELDQARRKLERSEKKAERIAKRESSSLLGTLHSDLNILTPTLNHILKEKVITSQIRNELEKLFSFLTSYERQVRVGAIKDVRIREGYTILNTKEIDLPIITINLNVRSESGDRKHLLADIFVEKVRSTEGIQNKNLLTAVFRLSETGLIEAIGRSIMKKQGISIRNGKITINKELRGEPAEKLAMAMRFLQYAPYFLYVPLGLALLYILILFMSRALVRRRLKALGRILFYPSLLLLLALWGTWIFLYLGSDLFTTMIPGESTGLFALVLVREALFQAGISLSLIFGPAFLAGMVILRILPAGKE